MRHKVTKALTLGTAWLVLFLVACNPSPALPIPPLPNLTPAPEISPTLLMGPRARVWQGGILVKTGVKTTLPFELKGDGHIFVRLNLTDSAPSLDYVLDTGSPVTILSPETATQLGLVPEIKLGDFEVSFVNLKIGQVEFADIGVMVRDLYTANLTNHLSCELKHGIIGQNVFRHAIWQFDYRQKTVTITDNLSLLEHITGAYQFELIEDSQLVFGPHHYLKVWLGEAELLGMIDTGRPTVEIKQPEFVAGGNLLPDKLEGRQTETTLKNLRIGSLTLTDFPATLVKADEVVVPRGRHGNWFFLGNSFLANFVVTLDYPNQVLYLSPYSANPATILPPPEAIYGFRPFYGQDNQLVVYRVVRPSAAQRAGLKEGDRILRINNDDFSTTTHAQACNLWLTGLDHQYNGPITVTVERAGQVRQVEIDQALNLHEK